MNKTFTFLASALLFGAVAVAQDNHKHCGTTEAMNAKFAQHLGAQALFEAQQAELEAQDAASFATGYKMANKSTVQGGPALYTIPVVFHILHTYGGENIPDANVIDQMNILNRDYRMLNADTAITVPAFQNVQTDAQIEFRLATKDPNGVCTNGIIHHYDVHTDWVTNSGYETYTWPRNKYLNIYVVKTIASGAAGYTYLPGSFGVTASEDAIVILYTYVGSLQPSSLNTSRALTHEVGHWLNLQHTWGSTNQPGVACGNDGVTDTPITKGYTSCQTGNSDICTAGIEENVQNYMDYSYCSTMFTAGQVARMQTTLSNNTGNVGRNNLWTPANLLATGVTNPNTLCAPIADFLYNKTRVCSGDSLLLTDISTNGAPSTWAWTTTGGVPATSTLQNPYITYNTPGTYTVTLVASNAAGTDTETKTALITVENGTATYQNGIDESWESITVPNSDWSVVNTENDGATWQQSTAAGYTGTKSMRVNNFNNNVSGNTDELISPTFNLDTLCSPTLNFRLAYRLAATGNNDKLQVFVSDDCGNSWQQRYSKSGTQLSSTVQATSFTPSGTAQWTTALQTVPLSSFWSKKNVRFKFVFTAGTTSVGNNLYIDDVKLAGPCSTVGLNQFVSSVNYFELYPNPSNGQKITVDLEIKENAENATLVVTDVLGQQVEVISSKKLDAGTHTIVLNNTANYAKGVYFLNMVINGEKLSRKFIVE